MPDPVQPVTLTDFIRQIRVLIGAQKFRKTGPTTWTNQAVTLEIAYYCHIGDRRVTSGAKAAQEMPDRECFPTSVIVRRATLRERFKLANSWDRPKVAYISWEYSRVRARTFKRRADGSFNLESIATAITKIPMELAAFEERVKAASDASDARRARIKALNAKLGKHKRAELPNGLELTCQAQADGYGVGFSVENLTIEEAKKLISFVKGLPKRTSRKD